MIQIPHLDLHACGDPGLTGTCRFPGEGLRPSDDSARPTYEADGTADSRDLDDISDEGRPTATPRPHGAQRGRRQWPPYQHHVVEIHPEDEEHDDEPQPLTRDIKGGALSMSLPERSGPAAAHSAFRPPPSPFRVSAA